MAINRRTGTNIYRNAAGTDFLTIPASGYSPWIDTQNANGMVVIVFPTTAAALVAFSGTDDVPAADPGVGNTVNFLRPDGGNWFFGATSNCNPVFGPLPRWVSVRALGGDAVLRKVILRKEML